MNCCIFFVRDSLEQVGVDMIENLKVCSCSDHYIYMYKVFNIDCIMIVYKYKYLDYLYIYIIN